MSSDATTLSSTAVSPADEIHTGDLPSECLNCGTTLEGRYCSECGQRASHENLTLHDFAHEAFHEFMHFDGKILRTFRLLVTKPGALTREFVEGKRARSISPVRVYLLTSVIFFALLSSSTREFELSLKVGAGGKTATEIEIRSVAEAEAKAAAARKESRSAFAKWITEASVKVAGRKKEFAEGLFHMFPKVMFVLMPLFALLIFALNFREQRLFVPHLYFSIHFHAFVFLIFTGMWIVSHVPVAMIGTLAFLLFLVPPPYFVMALHRVYGGALSLNVVKGVAIGFVYTIVLAASLVGVVLLKMAMM